MDKSEWVSLGDSPKVLSITLMEKPDSQESNIIREWLLKWRILPAEPLTVVMLFLGQDLCSWQKTIYGSNLTADGAIHYSLGQKYGTTFTDVIRVIKLDGADEQVGVNGLRFGGTTIKDDEINAICNSLYIE